MDPDLPLRIYIVFFLTTFSLFLFLLFAIGFSGHSKRVRLQWLTGFVISMWLGVTGYLAYCGFFQAYEAVPPRMIFGVLPPLITVIGLVAFGVSRRFLFRIPLFTLTYLHIIRIPVEIVLWWLYKQGLVPEMMTFEGGNWDILSGITAPFVAHFLNPTVGRHRFVIFIWNLAALGLLFNVVIRGILSAPYITQVFSFDQPNIGLLQFPFIWLPVFIVPAVLFSHLIAMNKLVRKLKK
ncbi:MAG: hypothetical protein RIB86_28365 [Imperialibacter sp.]